MLSFVGLTILSTRIIALDWDDCYWLEVFTPVAEAAANSIESQSMHSLMYLLIIVMLLTVRVKLCIYKISYFEMFLLW